MTDTPKSRALLYVYAPGIDTSTPVYSESFAGGAGGWTAGANTTQSAASGYLKLEPSSGETFSSSRSITGLTVGEVYTVKVDVKRDTNCPYQTLAGIRVDGLGGTSWTPSLSGTGTGPTVTLRHTFRATATSHTVVLAGFASTESYGLVSPSKAIRFDDLAIYLETPLPGFQSGSVTLDETHAPYARADVVMAGSAQLEALDPRASLRLFLTASLEWEEPTLTPQARDYDLYLHERTLNALDNTVTLVGQSDEALLIDAAALTEPSGAAGQIDDPRNWMTSERDIINMMLARHGGQLESSPSVDADFTITHDATNLILNPGAEVNTTGSVSSTATATLARNTTQQRTGSGCWSSTVASSTNAGIWYVGGSAAAPVAYMAVQEGSWYRFTIYVKNSIARDVEARIRWFSAAGTAMASGFDAAGGVVNVGTTYTKLTVFGSPPSGAVFAGPMVLGTGYATGNVMYLDDALFFETWPDESAYSRAYANIEPFSGATAGDAYYTYGWTGTANASTSTRTRLDSRDEMLLRQRIGGTDWDFVANLYQASGHRLFCDELRRWYLVDPASYTVAGTVEAREAENLTEASDTISLESTRSDGTPLWATGVVIRYFWPDPETLENRERFAVAGSRQKVIYLERNSPYPGDGEATRRLAAAQERGRVQELTALADLAATPGMALETSVPDTPDQTGMLAAVTQSWAADGDQHDIMTLTTRDLAGA